MTKFPKGSMGAADQKSSRNFNIVATIVILLLMSMIYLDFPHTYLNDWYRRAGTITNIVSVFPFLGAIYTLWFLGDTTYGEDGGKQYGHIVLGLVALGILISAGFNFSL